MPGLWRTGSGPNPMALHLAFGASLPMGLGACTDLTRAGITPIDFHGWPTDSPVVLGWMPAASVCFRDPDGHSRELTCPLNAPADPGFGIGPHSRLGRPTSAAVPARLNSVASRNSRLVSANHGFRL